MGNAKFSSLELSAIGEIINISLGASATAVSNMLDTKVDITTPNVRIQPVSDFDFSILDPAVCAEISYTKGLQGKNGLLLKIGDVKTIVEMLMQTEIPDDEFELNEFNLSAICEVMNQMMGAAATALSEFLDRTVDISTPTAYQIKDPEVFKQNYFEGDSEIVSVRFDLKIGDRLQSEFINIMRIPLAKELVHAFIPDDSSDDQGMDDVYNQAAKPAPATQEVEVPSSSGGGGGVLSQEEIEKLLQGGITDDTPSPEPSPTPAPVPTPVASAPAPAPMPQNMGMPQNMNSVPYNMGMPMQADPNLTGMLQNMMEEIKQLRANQEALEAQKSGGKLIKSHPIPNKGITVSGEAEYMDNKNLVMGVPLELSVEIGRTRKTVREILDLSKGSLVVLDKAAGEQVDLFVNGQCIARGDVVVVEDNFGLRITEIINKNDIGF